jgi:hypothetical protein
MMITGYNISELARRSSALLALTKSTYPEADMANDHPIFTPEEIQSEVWKPVLQYEGYYEVSNLGRVRSVRSGRGTKAGRILNTPPDTDGYPRVRLSRFNKPVDVNVHVLVALTFIGPCPEGLEVNHKDLKRNNNRASNLEYLTHSENQQHAANARRASVA